MFSAEWWSFSSFLLKIHILWCTTDVSPSVLWLSWPLLAQPFTSIGFDSSGTSGYLKLKGGLWVADLGSGFWSLCSQGAPHPSIVCPALQLLLTLLRDDSLHQSEHRNSVECVINAPLPHSREAIHSFNTLHVKGKSCTGSTHHIKVVLLLAPCSQRQR